MPGAGHGQKQGEQREDADCARGGVKGIHGISSTQWPVAAIRVYD